jgi:hypothetical protein
VNSFRHILAACVVVTVATRTLGRGGADMVDSLPVTGHYAQNGRALDVRSMEKVLLARGPSADYADRAKAYRLSASVIGATLWTASLAVSAVQFASIYSALKKGQTMVARTDQFTLPLLIGGELGSFVQGRLGARGNYLFHRAVLAYNGHLCKERGPDVELDHHIVKPKRGRGWYLQDGLAMSTETLYRVLGEQPTSRGGALRSRLYRETASRTTSVGITFIFFAVMSALEGETDRAYLGTGIGLTSFGIVNAISALVSRSMAVKAYNETVPATIRCSELP